MAGFDQAAYGSHHKRQRQALMYRLEDGAECEYCSRPMYREPKKNFDEAPLEADHESADTSRPANRLIHRSCNRAIITKWAKHGPLWFESHGFVSSALDFPEGAVTAW